MVAAEQPGAQPRGRRARAPARAARPRLLLAAAAPAPARAARARALRLPPARAARAAPQAGQTSSLPAQGGAELRAIQLPLPGLREDAEGPAPPGAAAPRTGKELCDSETRRQTNSFRTKTSIPEQASERAVPALLAVAAVPDGAVAARARAPARRVADLAARRAARAGQERPPAALPAAAAAFARRLLPAAARQAQGVQPRAAAHLRQAEQQRAQPRALRRGRRARAAAGQGRPAAHPLPAALCVLARAAHAAAARRARAPAARARRRRLHLPVPDAAARPRRCQSRRLRPFIAQETLSLRTRRLGIETAEIGGVTGSGTLNSERGR